MPKQLISNFVCLSDYPTPNESEPVADLTIGDLHGNALKLIYFLVRENILELTKPQYDRLAVIYGMNIEDLTQEHLDEFEALIKAAPIQNRTTQIRLLGDEMCDRGNNDYFTLKVLEKLYYESINYEILLSNHGIGFVEAYEQGGRFEYPKLGELQACSLYRMQRLIDKGLLEKEAVLELAQTAYKYALKAISYSLDTAENRISIFSHAPIGLEALATLAEKFQVDYDDSSTFQLAETIDKINQSFSAYALSNTIHTLYQPDVFSRISVDPSVDTVIEIITWNRDYGKIRRPENYNGFVMHWTHGHDTFGTTNEFCFNLDNDLGKASWTFDRSVAGESRRIYIPSLIGEYRIIRSTEMQLIQSPDFDYLAQLPTAEDAGFCTPKEHTDEALLTSLFTGSLPQQENVEQGQSRPEAAAASTFVDRHNPFGFFATAHEEAKQETVSVDAPPSPRSFSQGER